MDESPDSTSRLSGHGFTADELAQIDALGVPFIDSRSIPDDKICRVMSFPMMPSRPDQHDAAPWSSMSFAPIPIIAFLYQSLGATVRNVVPVEPGEGQVKGWTAKEAIAYRAFVAGDSATLGAAMLME